MIVAVNTIPVGKNTPITLNNYIYEAFTRIAQQHPGNTFLFILDRPYPEITFAGNIIPVVMRPAGPPSWWWKLWYNFKLPFLVKKYNADVLVTGEVSSSLLKIPQCLVIERPVFSHDHTFVKRNNLRFHRRNTRHFLQKVTKIIATSQACKTKILNHFEMGNNKIELIRSGIDPIFRQEAIAERENVKQQYTGGNEFFLITIGEDNRPDLLQLLKAFSIFKKRLKSNMQLLIIDTDKQQVDTFAKSLRLYKFGDAVQHIHSLSKTETANITAAAYAMIHTAQYDYSGYPVLQGLKSGVPVITDNSGALPEIVGDAALFIESTDPASLAEKMMLLYKDERLRNELVIKGIEKAKNYNWEETARLLWEVVVKIRI